MNNAHCRTWNIEKNLKNVENETQLFHLEYGEKHSNMWKMRNAHCRTWIMAGKQKKMWNMRHKHFMTWNMERNTEKC